MRHHALILIILLIGCTDNTGGGGGGSDVTTHVIQIEFPATPNLYCFDPPLADVDPNTLAAQYDCSVSDVTNAGQPNQVEIVLPQCSNLEAPDASTNRPCWVILVDPTNCPTAGHQSMVIERSGAPPADAKVVAQCVAQTA